MKKSFVFVLSSVLITMVATGCTQTTVESKINSDISSDSGESSLPVSSDTSVPVELPTEKGNLVEVKLHTFNFSRAHTLKDNQLDVLSNYDIGERTYHYVEGLKYDFYVTLDEYFDIIKTNMKSGYDISVSRDEYVFKISAKDGQNKRIGWTEIDLNQRTIECQGTYSTALNGEPSPDYDTYSIWFDTKFEDTHTIPYADRVEKQNFKYIDFHFYEENDKVYFPLSLLSVHFSKDIDVSYVFDENNMYFYDSQTQITSIFYGGEPLDGTVDDNLYDWVNKNFKNSEGKVEMPLGIAKSNRDEF